MKNNMSDFFIKMKCISAERLNEVMDIRNTSRTELRRLLEQRYAYSVTRHTLYKYLKAVNFMPQEFIEIVSKILDVDSGYLSGQDHFICKTYFDYLREIKG